MLTFRCAQCAHPAGTEQSDCDCCNAGHCAICAQPNNLCVCCKACTKYPCECINAPKSSPSGCSDPDCPVHSGASVECGNENSDHHHDGQGVSEDAPWVGRGHTIKAWTYDQNWKDTWPLIDDTIDLCSAAADYYLLEATAHNLVNRLHDGQLIPVDHGPFVTLCIDTIYDAGVMFDALVRRLTKAFREYCHLAIGGELRHHRAVGGRDVLNRTDRTAAWVGWRQIYETVGVEAIKDAETLFRETNWNSSYGGKKWAEACSVLYAYETGKLPDRVFVDRVFDLQHNGGILLNKINWAVTNKRQWDIGYVQSKVLPAHGESPEPNWRLLLRVASKDVHDLFMQHWDAMNLRRTDPIHVCTRRVEYPATANPFEGTEERTMCSYCNSNPTAGHTLTCSLVAAYGNASSKSYQLESHHTMTVEDDSFDDYDWSTWKKPADELPFKANFELNLDYDIELTMSWRKRTYSGHTEQAKEHETRLVKIVDLWNLELNLENDAPWKIDNSGPNKSFIELSYYLTSPGYGAVCTGIASHVPGDTMYGDSQKIVKFRHNIKKHLPKLYMLLQKLDNQAKAAA